MRSARFLLLVLVPACFGYTRLQTSTTPSFPLIRVDNTAIQFYINESIVPGVQSGASGANVTVISADSNPQAAIHAALATWNAVSTANVTFLPLKTTSAVVNGRDFQETIVIGSTPADVSVVNGALAFTVSSYALQSSNVVNGQLVVCSANCTYEAGSIFDSDIVLNPGKSFSTTGATNTIYDLQAVMTHEFGHSLGANHTGLLGAAMFQYTTVAERSLSADDIAFVNAIYPGSVSPASMGTISGTISGSGGSPVPYALLTMADTSSGATFGALANEDGIYSAEIPPGSYQVYAEPLNGLVQAPYLYLHLSGDQAAEVIDFQSTMFSGHVDVAPNSAATANIVVSGGTSALQVPYVSVTSANGPIRNSFNTGGPTFVASGQSVDLLLAGPGFDGTLTDANFAVYGQGISVHPGRVRLDPATVGTPPAPVYPVLRVTLDVAPRETLSLASLFVTKGGSTLSLSGALVVGPPAPVTTSQGFVSAASGLGDGNGNGAVSPGEYTAVYGKGLGPTKGPVYGGFPNTGYDNYGFLPPDLQGVSVTFDGVPAPIFFLSAGQINLEVPFEIAGKPSTQVIVNFMGSVSTPVTVPVLESHPAFFTVGASSAAYIGNPRPDATGNYTNSTGAPASAGDYVTIYGTGAGKPAYAIQTGKGAPTPPAYSADGYGFNCSIGGINTPVLFAGWTPTAVGLAQWNVQVPASLTATGAVPVTCSNSNGSTQSGLTLFVK